MENAQRIPQIDVEEDEVSTLVVNKKEKSIIKETIENAIKRLVDIIGGMFGFILIIPMTIIIYIVRKILKENDGPIFYEQLRIGKDGKYFRMYKYRTMIVGADKILKQYLEENEEAKKEYEKNHKLRNDPRITELGKFLRKTSLDEIPQLLNVLIGNMSLVGPRPYLPEEKECIGRNFEIITSVKPGITGLWQVSGRSYTNFKERVKMETLYVKNKSLKNDIKILLKTIKIVIKKEGAI